MEIVKSISGRTLGFCGAGGKTTSIFYLAGELIKMKQKVLITTTTKMYPATNFNNLEIVIRETFFEEDLKERDAVQWFSKINAENKGVSPALEEIEKTNKYTDIWKLIEIDGSKHLPIKAPNPDEPVYPKGLDMVFGVIGASAFNQPADRHRVHRLERFLEVTGLEENQIIDQDAVLRLIEAPKGLFQNKPDGVEARVLITQVRACHTEFIQGLKEKSKVPIEVMPWIE